MPTTDSRATVRVAWSADAIHAHIHVKDANVLRSTFTSLPNTPTEFYDSDNVQIFFAVENPGTFTTDAFQLFMIPPDTSQGALYPDEYSYAGDGYDYYTSTYYVFSYASRIVADGYEVELKATVPTGVTLTSATSVLFDVQVGVKDTTNASTRDFEYAYAYNCTGTCPEGPYYLTSYWCNPTLE
ncbi:MAG: hypothetical protein JXR91_11485 [Deltaproteobacteria bacterium]|nr:hypothetical protein [Deltaproteobacteria bacterium]